MFKYLWCLVFGNHFLWRIPRIERRQLISSEGHVLENTAMWVTRFKCECGRVDYEKEGLYDNPRNL